MTFAQAERFLLSRRRFGIKLGLNNMRRAVSLLDHPEASFPSVHVAGSKGKGSVCAMIESILLAAGIPAGLYTSPHLVTVLERIRVGGKPITPRAFTGQVEALRKVFGDDGPPLTYFEWLTTMALSHFAEKRVPLALLEVGMGGRLDATNIVSAPLAIVTEIEKEHSEHLGDSLGRIAGEKAGIVKEGAVLLSGATSPTARKALAATALQRGARHLPLDRLAEWKVLSSRRRGLVMDLRVRGERFNRLRVGLAGRHQSRNAALAVLAAQELASMGFPVGRGAIRRGLALVSWPGRCEYRPGNPAYFLDGAHTPSSVLALAAALDELFPSTRKVLLFGALGDKKISRLAGPLVRRCRQTILVRPPEERGAEPGEVLRALPGPARKSCVTASGIGEAVSLSEKAAGSRGLVVVAGSLFLVGAVLRRHSGRSRKVRRGRARRPLP